MVTNRKSLLDEIKRTHSGMPEALEEMLSNIQDEASLEQVKETMRKDGDKYHFQIENDEYIVSGGKRGERFSLLKRSEDGEEVAYSQSGTRSSFFFRGDDFVSAMQSNGDESRLIGISDDGSVSDFDLGRGVLQISDGDGKQMVLDTRGISARTDDDEWNLNKNGGNTTINWGDGTVSGLSYAKGKGKNLTFVQFDLTTNSEKKGDVQVGFENGSLCSIKQNIGNDKEVYDLQYQNDKVVYEATVDKGFGKDKERIVVFEDGMEYSYVENSRDKTVNTERFSLEGRLLDGGDGSCSFVDEVKEAGKTVYKKAVSVKRVDGAFYSKTEYSYDGKNVKTTYAEVDGKIESTKEVEEDYAGTKMRMKCKWVDGTLVSRQCWEGGECVYEFDVNKGEKNKNSENMEAWLKHNNLPDKPEDESDLRQMLTSCYLRTNMKEFEIMGGKRKGNNLEAYMLEIDTGTLKLDGDIFSIADTFRENLSLGGIPIEIDGKERNNQPDDKGAVILRADDNFYYKGSVEGFPQFMKSNERDSGPIYVGEVFVGDRRTLPSMVDLYKKSLIGR